MRSVDDKMVTEMLPKTFKAMEKWDGKELPEEEVFNTWEFPFASTPPIGKKGVFEGAVDPSMRISLFFVFI